MIGVAHSRDLWLSKHQSCVEEPGLHSIEEARYVIATHAAHGPDCLQYLAADAYSHGSGDGDDI